MAKTQTLTDSFSTQSGSWGGFTANVLVSGGQLRITPNSGYNGIFSSTTYDLTSSFILVNLVTRPNLGNGTTSATINAAVSSGNSIDMLVEGTNLVLRERVGSVNSDTSVAFDATTHAWWRIRQNAGVVYWETSANALSWTTRRSKATSLTLTTVSLNIFSGFYGTEPAPGVAVFDYYNIPTAPTAVTSGWVKGRKRPVLGTVDTGTVLYRSFFQTADWLWNPIPASPVLDPQSANIATMLSANSHGIGSHDFGVVMLGPQGITASTPRYDVTFQYVPAYGPDPFGADTVPIPDGTPIPPGSDGHVTVLDPTTNKCYSVWQTTHNTGNNTWGGSFGGVCSATGDGRENPGTSSTATLLARYAAVIRLNEIAARQIPHALFFASDACKAGSTSFRYPAQKTDGDNAAGVTYPIEQGTRVQLDPSINLAAIPNITAAELAIGKALQVYGAYCGDKGGSRMGFIGEYTADYSPGTPWYDAGIPYDYFNMTHLPWSSLRVLKNWDGTA